jgi:hypothetical protein
VICFYIVYAPLRRRPTFSFLDDQPLELPKQISGNQGDHPMRVRCRAIKWSAIALETTREIGRPEVVIRKNRRRVTDREPTGGFIVVCYACIHAGLCTPSQGLCSLLIFFHVYRLWDHDECQCKCLNVCLSVSVRPSVYRTKPLTHRKR